MPGMPSQFDPSQSSEAGRAFTVQHVGRGRAVYVQPDGALYVGRGSAICRSADDGQTWTTTGVMPRSVLRRLAEASRLACRLLRHELRAMVVLGNGTCVAANREGVFYSVAGERRMRRSRVEDGGIRARPPMCITLGPSDRVLWGEYWGNPERREVRVFVSDDTGQSFAVAHVFAAGQIRHVHNIVYDPRAAHYWVLTGDHDQEPGIGRLSADLVRFDWLVRGRQHYRAVCLFDFDDRLVYGTDAENEPNAIMRLDKSTGRVERLVELPGSCIYGCRFGPLHVLSTTVEPSRVNISRHATLWVSRDGEQWTPVYQAPGDRWLGKFFQYGSLVLPRGVSSHDSILFSGQALRGLDGQLLVARWSGPSSRVIGQTTRNVSQATD